jgi:hypothetical protein
MLKPYKDRVFAVKSTLEAIIKYVGENSEEIIKVNLEADNYAMQKYAIEKNPYPLTFDLTGEYETFPFKGIKAYDFDSWITGGKITNYTNEKFESEIPFYDKMKVVESVIAPDAYLIPGEWGNVLQILKLHGVKIITIKQNKEFIVEKIIFKNVKFAEFPYEGRFQPSFDFDVIRDTVVAPIGTNLIKTNQRTVGVILHLLEPKGRDSFVQWGFFNAIFERKEYFDNYTMESIAQEMMDSNHVLKSEFQQKLAEDEEFRNSARQRLFFFYKKSPYYDKKHNVYPVLRVMNLAD